MRRKYWSSEHDGDGGYIYILDDDLRAINIEIEGHDVYDVATSEEHRKLLNKEETLLQQFMDLTGRAYSDGGGFNAYSNYLDTSYEIIKTYNHYFGFARPFSDTTLQRSGDFDGWKLFTRYDKRLEEINKRSSMDAEWHAKMKETMAWYLFVEQKQFGDVQITSDELYGQLHSIQNSKEITIIEPLMCSTMRPTEYRDIGCWGMNSNVFPYIERFKLRMDFQQKQNYFEVDTFTAGDVLYDPLRQTRQLPSLKITGCKSKLHCTFVAHPCNLPAVLNTLHFDVHKLGQFTMTKGQTQTINFQDIEYRNTIQQILFFCKTEEPEPAFHNGGQSASITALQLRTDVSNQNISLQSRHHCDAMTTRNYPQYNPPHRCYRERRRFDI